MRLLKIGNNDSISLTKDFVGDDEIPPYAILSHLWQEGQEVTFDDMTRGSGDGKAGWDKIRFCVREAGQDGLRYVWVDTCCINKTDTVELQDAINSMSRWYRDAAACYVFLSDVSTAKQRASNEECIRAWENAFRNSRWFTRGWTLQELIAPRVAKFFSREWEILGSKDTLQQLIQQATQIPVEAFLGCDLSSPYAPQTVYARYPSTLDQGGEYKGIITADACHFPSEYQVQTASTQRNQLTTNKLLPPDTMDLSFITVHDVTKNANVLYSSDSIYDVLGYTPTEVCNHSVWQFFHPEDLHLAKARYRRVVAHEKVAVLSYCRLKNCRGEWVDCECYFSIVYDILVCRTTVYRQNPQSKKRAIEAAMLRSFFALSPKDPRYQMMAHLSRKYSLRLEDQIHEPEPRAALFLNQFTRTLTIMYATSGIEQIVGVSNKELKGKSFYYCITIPCLTEAVRCMEIVRECDSFAYMRFMFRDPCQEDLDESSSSGSDDDDITKDRSNKKRSTEGGVRLSSQFSANGRQNNDELALNFCTDSGDSSTHSPSAKQEDIELEAFILRTTDGIVVCLRRARPILPGAMQLAEETHQYTVL
ncbi:hypothetical protein OPT61_g5624 [Boeremia exigua]|uniref:Uncharacterized protein n=1 Tax=Boeremia exigua TaxID=749465 RepID=A0ACC2I9V1_9PLEO|nr:hypothetical protein OPT61_g5624 [Boeremia exigua]